MSSSADVPDKHGKCLSIHRPALQPGTVPLYEVMDSGLGHLQLRRSHVSDTDGKYGKGCTIYTDLHRVNVSDLIPEARWWLIFNCIALANLLVTL